MEFRLAVLDDLEKIKDMYRKIVKDMNENNIEIWDDVYPCEFFENDIKNRRMYILVDKSEIIAAFVLSNTDAGENAVRWSDASGKAIYLDRLGVSPKRSNSGIGSLMIGKAKEIAKSLGNQYLRLFVVDINIPAIKLYIKNGFEKAEGIYDLVVDDGLVLQEYGYEIKV